MELVCLLAAAFVECSWDDKIPRPRGNWMDGMLASPSLLGSVQQVHQE